MKVLSLLIFYFIFYNSSYGQQKYLTTNGFVNFFSHSSMEDISADNKQAMSIVDMEKNEIVIHILMKSFLFEKSLMQEHFNENYVESDKFPKAKFNGEILNFDPQNSAEQNVEIQGKLNLHGKTNDVKTKALLIFKDKKLSLKGNFSILLADYDVKIPKTVINNISETIKVSFEIDHNPYEK